MTTIAWDGLTVAADGLKTRGGYLNPTGDFSKLFVDGAAVYAILGSAALVRPLIDWVKAGANPVDIPKDKGDDRSIILVFENKACFAYSTDLPYPEEMFAPDAWGSGGEIAIGAMDAGAHAHRAVQIAAARNPGTGGKITSINLDEVRQRARLAERLKDRPRPDFSEAGVPHLVDADGNTI